MYILPTFLRTFLIISVILKTLVFNLEEILKGELRCSRNMDAFLLFQTLEKLLKELQNPAASLDLILTEQLQTKQVC